MRVAVLGLGFMGSTHLKAWRNVAGAQVAAVYSNDPRKLTGDLSGVQGNFGSSENVDLSNVRKYRAIDELLADKEIDAVDICLPTHLHSSTALEALRAGKDVLVEKPIALTGEIADSIVDEAKKQDRILMAAQVLRFFPSYRVLHEAVRSGQLGRVHSAFFRRRCSAPTWNQWLGDASKSGGGVFDLLIHDIDMCLMLFGAPESVSATGHEDLQQGIDTIVAILHYGEIPSVTITGGWHHKKAYPFSMEYTAVMQEGTYEYSSQRDDGAVTLYSSDGESQPVSLPEEDGFEAELRYFTECCTQRQAPELCPPEESAEAVRLALRMLEARKANGEKLSYR